MKNEPMSSTPKKRKPAPPALRPSPILLCAAMLAFTAACSQSDAKKSAEAPANVTLSDAQLKHIHIYTVKASQYRTSVEANSEVDFDQDRSTSVLAPLSGPVSRLMVQPGDHVERGALLATVDSPDFAAAVAGYRKAAAAAHAARRVAAMDKDLLARQGVSQREADQAQSDAVAAESDEYAAFQTLLSLNIDPKIIKDIKAGRSIAPVSGAIRAPLEGTVVERLITPGQLLQAGATPCFTIADLSKVWVMAQVFGADVAAIGVGDPAEVMMGPDAKPIAGRVDNVGAEVDPNTRSVTVRVVADNPGEVLKKHMYVRVRIRSGKEISGILAPISAILRDDENLPFVYVTEDGGGFARRHVTLGGRVGESYQIPAGLKAGDRIVVDGAIFVQFMQDQ